ncbi:MAG: exopolysaccharide biosynthesis protein [Reyranella sp.]|nr:exopolysaccharide biosynthesis protein [Reyranella sp.]
MKDNFGLLQTLEELFAGDRKSLLTLDEFLGGLHGRSYAFAIAALNVPNCIPTGIPWLSTITGLPMVVLLVQFFAGREVPRLPSLVGRRGLQRGKLQTFLGRARRCIQWLENTVHARQEWLVNGMPRRALLVAWAANIVILALPIPFDNFLPAWAIMFICLALIEDDGVMAMLGWLLTVATAIWTVFLLMVGHAAVMMAIATIKRALFQD